jgi:hypothetical protein
MDSILNEFLQCSKDIDDLHGNKEQSRECAQRKKRLKQSIMDEMIDSKISLHPHETQDGTIYFILEEKTKPHPKNDDLLEAFYRKYHEAPNSRTPGPDPNAPGAANRFVTKLNETAMNIGETSFNLKVTTKRPLMDLL